MIFFFSHAECNYEAEQFPMCEWNYSDTIAKVKVYSRAMKRTPTTWTMENEHDRSERRVPS